MVSPRAVCLFLSLAAGASAVTPIEKVLSMMGDMVTKGVAAKNDEAQKFSAFDQWCTDTKRTKSDEIAAGNMRMEELNAEIEKCGVDIRQLTDRIEELDEDNGRWAKDRQSASDVRSREAADFKATVADYTESCEALAGAIKVLREQEHDRNQAEFVQSLVQVQSLRLVPVSTKKALTAFLQQPVADLVPDAMPSDELSYQAPEAYGYSFQSGGVVDMLQKLEDEFKTKKRELEEEELKAQQAFALIMQQLADDIENAEHEISKKTALRAETEEAKAAAQGDLAATTAERNDDQTYLDDTDVLCQTKTADFNARQKLRQEELDAIKKAMEIIGSSSVAGSGEKHLPALVQIRSAKSNSFAQLRSNQQSPIQGRIADFLAERARVTGSPLLAQVASRVAADPFGKVKKMIKNLISKLMEEATSETEHKGWCDTELSTNKLTREKKTEQVNILASDIEDLTATIADLSADIARLAEELKELAATMAKATAERGESKAKNEQTIADAKAAQTAVEEAMAVLKDFYAKSAEATALEQQPAVDAPETFDKPYTGMGTNGGDVVSFLEVILSDFGRLESETSSDEATEDDEYKTFMFESEKSQALKENEKRHKEETKTAKESALHGAEEELKLTQEALDKANAYYDKLKPTCVDSGITYEERVKRREAEIQSLSEALKILAGTDVDVA